jgi:hypothetical protein
LSLRTSSLKKKSEAKEKAEESFIVCKIGTILLARFSLLNIFKRAPKFNLYPNRLIFLWEKFEATLSLRTSSLKKKQNRNDFARSLNSGALLNIFKRANRGKEERFIEIAAISIPTMSFFFSEAFFF